MRANDDTAIIFDNITQQIKIIRGIRLQIFMFSNEIYIGRTNNIEQKDI